MPGENNQIPILSQQLLLGLAEELKTPLQQIARRAELGAMTGKIEPLEIQSIADSALKLIDNYALGVRLSMVPEELEIEAVSVSSVLYDACQQLDKMAKNYGVELQMSIAGRFGPVAAHRQGLQAALVSLGSALIEALPATGANNQQLCLKLATHRSRYGIVAGVYSDTKKLTNDALVQARKLQAVSRQPLINVSHTSGAGVFVADAILKSMNLNLTASRHQSLYGLGTVLQPNHQMQLV